MNRGAFFFLTLLAAGCSSPTAPHGLPTSVRATPIAGAPPPLTISTSASVLRIQWWILMNEPCYDFTASTGARADSLVVTLTAVRRPGFCQQVVTPFAYTLVVLGAPSGPVPLSLIYDRHGYPTFRETVLDTTVTVP
jgi:hypothetical protein